ncbi:MAG: putative bifunctional diguanylate cyclase/phosphodiesterase [Rudaea sp.]
MKIDAPEMLARSNRVLRTLRAGHRALLRATGERQMLQSMCEALLEERRYAVVWIGYAERDDARSIRPVAHAGDAEHLVARLALSWDAARPSVSGEAIRTGAPSFGRRLSSDPLLARWRDDPAHRGFGAVSALPLRVGAEVIGCLTLVAYDADAFDPTEVALLEELADDIGYGIAHVRMQARHAEAERTIERMAFRDPLTDLPNRASMRLALAKARERSRPFAVLSIHVAHFDEISDALGRDMGDRLLVEVARRIGPLAGAADDALARVGDDELVLLLTDVDAEPACDVARRIVEALFGPMDFAGTKIDARSAIGIALYPGHGEDPEELMRRAKVAMHRGSTRGGYALYSGLHDDERRRQLALIGDLRRAIDADELLLYCQPKADVATRRLCGAEALMRWRHPRQGMVSPTLFVGLAEHAGLITPLTHWVLEAAFRERHRWHRAGLEQPLAVNVSARDLHDPHLVERVRGLMATWGTQPGWIEFELTESSLMEEPESVIGTLVRLRDLGIELMVDDYGTGYSSLRYLQQMPVSGIKIDQSFVRRMLSDADSAAIVRSTIELCHALELRATAEGVENESTWRALAELGCDAVQGFYVGRPLPVGEFEAWASASRWGGAENAGKARP